MKRLLLILLCLPMIGFGQEERPLTILSLNKEIQTLNENILHQKFINDSLRNSIDSLEEEIMHLLGEDNTCSCQVGGEEEIVKYWDNGTMKYYGWVGTIIKVGEETPKYEWHRNGKLKTIYIYGGCEYDHELEETIDFDENGECLDLYTID